MAESVDVVRAVGDITCVGAGTAAFGVSLTSLVADATFG